MPIVDAVVESPVVDSFRVQQVAGLFDLPPAGGISRCQFRAEVPGVDEDWTIGAIVGPSGSGKSTIARKAFGPAYHGGKDWPAGRAVIDCFAQKLSIKQITACLTAVGFSSPPAWLRPFAALSNGEQFRCQLARALLESGEILVFDEFTSVVDRTVAQIGSAAVAKSLRARRLNAKKFVAVTCHYDVLDWLSPDWILDMATCRLERGLLRRRPPIRLQVHRCRHEVWSMFKRHHYLSADLHRSAQCYLATWQDRPTCFAAILPVIGFAGMRRVSRIVTLPDFQGVGIGMSMLNALGQIHQRERLRLTITTSHPGMIAGLKISPTWLCTQVKPHGGTRHGQIHNIDGKGDSAPPKTSSGRCVVSFEYRGARP